MKAYTNLEQSKKLAEILPKETADFRFRYYSVLEGWCDIPHYRTASHIKDLPCWSLAALLNVLPKLGAEEPRMQKLYYANNPIERYICQYSLTNITGEYDNPVDACYEMILELKERDLL